MLNTITLMKTLLTAVVFVLSFTLVPAQSTPKFGFTNIDIILGNMNESQQVQAELQAYQKQVQKKMELKYTEYQTLLQELQQGGSTLSAAEKNDKERRLTNLQTELQQFQEDAEKEYNQRQQRLLQPLYARIDSAIKAIAIEDNYTYIFNSDAGLGTTPILLHAPENDNVTEKVLAKLGVDVAKLQDE